MEPANADRITSTELRKNEESENDIHPPLSICYSEKSYEQCSPPVCYVELAGHKSTKDQQSLADSASEFPTEDGKIETADLDTLDGSSSTPRSVLIVKDGDNGECASIIPTPPQSVVPSSVVQDQRNATTTSVPGPLVDASLEPLSESRLVIVEKDSIDEEDIDERPLVVDLGDSPRSASPTEEKVCESKASGGVFRKPSIPASKISLKDIPSPHPPSQSSKIPPPVTVTTATTKAIPSSVSTPVTKSSSYSTSTTIPVTSSQSTSVSVTAPNPTPPTTSTSSHSYSHPPPLPPTLRVQKPIRPFIPPTSHFIPPPPLLEISNSHSSTSVALPSQSTSQFLASTSSITGTSTTFRLQSSQLSHSNTQQLPLPPPQATNLSGPTAIHQQPNGGNNNNIQFMSVLASTPSQGPGGVQHPPIQLFNLAPMPGYLNPSSGLLFHSIPSALGGGANGGGNQSGTFHFAPPPPPPPPTLFSSHHHQQQAVSHHQPHPPQQQNFATRPNTPSSVTGSASLPPPPPLAPAPGISSLHSRATGGNSVPMAGVFIPDMNSWMASVTGTQGMMPPLQSIFSCQQPSASISGPGEPPTFSFANTTTSVPTTATTVTTITLATSSTSANQFSLPGPNPQLLDSPRPTSTPISIAMTQMSEKTPVPITVNGNTSETLSTSTVSATLPPSSSSLSISARRWRPSLASPSGKKTPSDQTVSPTEKPSVSKENTVAEHKSVSEHSASGTDTTISMTFSDSEKATTMLEQRKKEEEKDSSPESKEKLDTERLKEDLQKAQKKEKVLPKGEKPAPVETSTGKSSISLPSKVSKSSTHHVSKKKKALRQSSAPNVLTQSQSNTPSTVVPQRKIISHFIDGHVLYESNLPFPVRNATSFVESFLQKCNGGSRLREDIGTSGTISPSTESIYAISTTTTTVNSNEREEEKEPEQQHQQTKRLSDVDCVNGDDCTTMTATTTTTTPPLKVSSSSSNAGRKRRRPDAEMPKTEEEGDEEVKKKHKKSYLVIPTPSTSTALSSQNGHEEHLITTDETKSAASIDAKSTKTTTSVSIATTATSIGIGGIKMTIHPVYQSGGEKSTSKPVPQHSSLPPPSPSPSQSTVPSSPHLPSPPPPLPTTIPQIPIEVKQTPQPINHSTPAVASGAKPQAVPQSSTSAMAPPPPPPPGPMSKWTPRAVAEFVRGTSGCAPYADAFETNEVDGEALALLSSSTSNFIAPPLSMKIGHALKLANRVKTLTSSSTSYPDTIAG